MTTADFQEYGKRPSLKEKWKIWGNGEAKLYAQLLRKKIGIPSSPVDVVGFSLRRTSLTLSGVKIISLKPSSVVRLIISGK